MKPEAVVLASQHSPTGDASLPQWAVRLGLALVATSIVLKRSFPAGHPIAIGAEVVQEVAIILGIASQGVRR